MTTRSARPYHAAPRAPDHARHTTRVRRHSAAGSGPRVRTATLAPLAVAAAALSAGLALAPRGASAQVVERFSLRGEFGVGSMITARQRDVLGYDLALQGSGRLGFDIVDAFALQLSYSNWLFPSDRGNGGAMLLGGGVRIQPRIGSVGRVWLDGNVGAGITGAYTRPIFDVGLGFEFDLTRWLALGPMVRYSRLFTSDQDVPSDADFWAAGASVTLRIPSAPRPAPVVVIAPREQPARPAAPRDTDGDGVMDPDDVCVTEPAGEHPDPTPARRGCPERDTDGDGVRENQDQCPTTPQGANPDPARPGCPDGDDDADGVFNHADQCRTEPMGLHPDPARPGCPLPDRDHDTVPDATDHCPDQPGAPSPNPRRNGCPGLVRVEGGQIRILQQVFFATNSDRILPRSNRVLAAVVDALRASPEIRRLGVEGHTDNVGDATHNMNLSERRAESVRLWLTRHGVAPARLEAHGYGPTRPIADNTTAAGRAQNRRVEFHIVDPAPAPTQPPPRLE